MAQLKNTSILATDAVQLPVGTTAQRLSGSVGHTRYNSTLKTVEIYDGSRWRYMPDITRTGLVLHLDAAEPGSYPGSGTTWTDLSGSGNTSTLINGISYNSGNGGYLVFDGVDDYVQCGTFSVSYLTISTWIYRTATTTNQGICRKQNAWAVSVYNGTLQVAPGTSWQFYDTGYTIPVNTWINLVYTYTGSGSTDSQTVYINGTYLWSNSAGVGPLSTNSNLVRVGYDDNGWYWGGRIAQTQIYNRALTPQEILQNYIAIKNRF